MRRLKNSTTVLQGGPLDRIAVPVPQSLGTLPFTLRGQSGSYCRSEKPSRFTSLEWKQ